MVALFTTKAEYITSAEATKKAIWLKRLLMELGLLEKKIILYSDS